VCLQIYEGKGFTKDEATRLINTLTKKPEYTDYFIDHMMVQELGQVVPDSSDSPVKNGLVTFISFMLFGFVPLLAYIIFWAANYGDGDGQLGICAAVTLVTLFALGYVHIPVVKQASCCGSLQEGG
jgi:VIT1/CCC1 family predicted Fe2+/Mn2+ transporter